MKKENKIILILGIVIVAALAVFIGLVIFANMRNSDDSNNEVVEQKDVDVAAMHQQAINDAYAKLNIKTDFRKSLTHGPKPAANQKWIVLHDTEGDGRAENVVSGWDGNGKGVAAQFIVNKDGSIVQCVNIDEIAHHAGFGDTGHNAQFGVTEDGRDDMVGTVPIGSWASDYGMNAWSVGIEIVHVGGSGPYPEAQLQALDNLIAYIDAYYWNSPSGNGGQITDHKAWRSGNSDTSKEFASFLANYQSSRHH